MSLHLPFQPSVIDRTGVATLREAVRLAAKTAGMTSEEGRRHLGSIVLSFYRRGLLDPVRLAEIAVLASSSRPFRSQYYDELESSRSGDRLANTRLE